MMLYEEESWPEKISTKWPGRCHVTHHVHVAELKETTQVPPYRQNLFRNKTINPESTPKSDAQFVPE